MNTKCPGFTALVALAALTCFTATRLTAQMPPAYAVEEQREAMAKLAMMIGQWDGTGWIHGPEGRMNFHGGEIIQEKLRGLALLVEGSFFYRDPASGEEKPSHTTLGVISFDPRAKIFRFRSWLASGTTGEHELKLTDDGWQWQLDTPRGKIRYTTRFVGNQWIEIGEMSADETTWRKFFEMTLTRKS